MQELNIPGFHYFIMMDMDDACTDDDTDDTDDNYDDDSDDDHDDEAIGL